MASFKNKIIYKVYSESDVFISVLTDVVSTFSIHKSVNGGDGEFTIVLNRKIDDFSEDVEIKFNNRIRVYVQNEYNSLGDKLIGYGYITSYKPSLRGHEERVEVTCLSAVSKLKNDFFRLGTATAASELGVEFISKRADEMMEDIITHYRSTESNSMISNDYSNADATTDNSGNPISFDHRIFNTKHLEAIRDVSKFLPRNKSGNAFFYWRISTDGLLWVKNISTTADHTFTIGKHITEISGFKTIEGVVNKLYFWNEKPPIVPEFVKLTSDDVTSQGNYDIIAEYISDSKIGNVAAASLITSSRVYDKKDPKVQIKLTLNGEYDLSSVVPGQTCKILNAKENPFKVGSDTVLFIHSVDYEVDTAILEVSNAQERFEDMVDEERLRLDQEMTWYGRITQILSSAQLAPANRAWSTTISFSATTGADAYRQIDWTAGTIYIPAGESGSAAKRIVDIGNTGLMAPGSTYYIYLDEDTLPTTAAVVTRTGTSKQGGDTLTDSASPGWSNDQYKGYVVEIGGQKKLIKSNTASILTLEDRWTVADQTAQTYTISKLALSSTTSEETAMADSRIVFTNAVANTNTDSEAILTSGTGTDTIVDGETQIAQHSISANEIIAGTITATEIHVSTITADRLSFTAFDASVDDLGDINDGGGYGKVLSTNITAGQIILGQCSGNLDNISNGVSYGKVAITAISAGKILLTSAGVTGTLSTSYTSAKCTDANADQTSTHTAASISGQGALATQNNLDGVPNGSNYGKISITDINAGHITLVERTVSSRNISLDASVPHIKVAYNNSNVIQMCVVGTEPKLEVYYSSSIRMRLNKNGLYIFTTSGSQKARIYGSATSLRDLYFSASYAYFSGDVIINDDLSIQNDFTFSPNVAYNRIHGDGTYIYFDGTTNYHLIPEDVDASCTAQLGTSSHEWWSVWAQDTTINHDDLAEAEQVHHAWQLSKTKLEEDIRKKYQLQNDKIIKVIKQTKYKPVKSRPGLKTSKDIQNAKIEGILKDKLNEDFDIKKKRASKIELGSIVIISDEGCLPSNTKGQTNILGVVSTQPGIKLDSHAEGIYIAKVGKVPCRIVGKCEAGDLLQTSDIEGCAEKAENPKTGSIVGRAKETKTTTKEEKIKIEVQMM